MDNTHGGLVDAIDDGHESATQFARCGLSHTACLDVSLERLCGRNITSILIYQSVSFACYANAIGIVMNQNIFDNMN